MSTELPAASKIEKMKGSAFKQFKSDHKDKYFFIYSKGTDRWLVTDRYKKVISTDMNVIVGRYYPSTQEFHFEEIDPTKFKEVGKHQGIF